MAAATNRGVKVDTNGVSSIIQLDLINTAGKAIGGSIQVVPIMPNDHGTPVKNVFVLVDEDGMMKGLPLNPFLTPVLKSIGYETLVPNIVGSFAIAIVKKNGEYGNLTNDQISNIIDSTNYEGTK